MVGMGVYYESIEFLLDFYKNKGDKEMVFVNGKSVEYQKDMTLKELLLEQGFIMERIAVECNGEIVPKAVYDKRILKEEDRLEVVNFVGGG